jgi:NTP pyrophosphatase (non-canonical NTP hydrolase)
LGGNGNDWFIGGKIMLNELRDKVHENAKAHGFYDSKEVNIPEKLMLIVSELGEAMEAYRKGHHCKFKVDIQFDLMLKSNSSSEWNYYFEHSTIKDSFEDELADTIIRLLDLCGYMDINIDKHIDLKMKYNESRPYKHGKIC